MHVGHTLQHTPNAVQRYSVATTESLQLPNLLQLPKLHNMTSYRDLISAILMLAFAALVIWVLIPVGVVEPKKVKFAALSPSYYPRIVAIALLLLGAGVFLRSLLTKTVVITQTDRHPNAPTRTICFLLILLLLALTLNWLGFIVASSIAMLLALWLGGERRLWLTLPLSVFLPLFLYFFFLKVARIPIPLGVLEPWLAGV